MEIYVVTYEDMYDNHSVDCAFYTFEDATAYMKKQKGYGYTYDYEVVELKPTKEKSDR